MSIFYLGEDQLNFHSLDALVKGELKPTVSASVKDRVTRFRRQVEAALSSDKSVYGINTGFGFLSDVAISNDQLEELQVNLVRSHACGVGSPVDDDVVAGLLILRLHTFCLGHTGISLDCVEHILTCLDQNIRPEIPEKGSVGASGDLAPLAHLALGLMGEGRVREDQAFLPASEVFKKRGLRPYQLKPKEGLSLINGTHFMAVLGARALSQAEILLRSADVILAMSLDAIRGTTVAFDERIHDIRPQPGQQLVASNLRRIFAAPDPIRDSHEDCGKVQDPYSFRCAPQVHGASRDAQRYVSTVVNAELNAVTDNPLCFHDENDAIGSIISGGNFHGQPVALAMDFLAIAMSEIGSISERRIEKLTNPAMSGLPAFVTRDSGVNSGYMIPHVVAAALVSENKGLCHPASVDSIPTSADKEDHVSMGPIAARQALSVIDNVAHILSIELLTACQGIDLMAPLQPNAYLKTIYEKVRSFSDTMNTDRSLHQDIAKTKDWLLRGQLLRTLPESLTIE